jgi:hypothetical protein
MEIEQQLTKQQFVNQAIAEGAFQHLLGVPQVEPKTMRRVR